MNEFNKIYKISLRDARARTKKALRENENCYNSLKNKDSDYAVIIKAMQDLHRQASEVYENAADDILITNPRSMQ